MLQLKKRFDVRGCARSNFFKLFCLQLVLSVFKIKSEIALIFRGKERNEKIHFVNGFFPFFNVTVS